MILFVQNEGITDKVKDFMRDKDRVCVKEISDGTGINLNAVLKQIHKLKKWNEVEFVCCGSNGKTSFWRLV